MGKCVQKGKVNDSSKTRILHTHTSLYSRVITNGYSRFLVETLHFLTERVSSVSKLAIKNRLSSDSHKIPRQHVSSRFRRSLDPRNLNQFDEHPTEPMEPGVNNAKTFLITRTSHRECPLLRRTNNKFLNLLLPKLETTTYSVLKELKGNNAQYIVIPGTDHDFTHRPSNFPKLYKGLSYMKQIAYARCSHGYIKYVQVFERPNGKDDGFNGRQCGIATVLTELCLIDPMINKKENGNYAYDKLKNEPQISNLVKDCNEMVGLTMAADPMSGAFAYFKAAIKWGYNKLVIYREVYRDLSLPLIPQFEVYDTQIAKQNYCPKTGNIAPCNDKEVTVEAYMADWIFCKVIQNNS